MGGVGSRGSETLFAASSRWPTASLRFDPLDGAQFTFDEVKVAPDRGWPRGEVELGSAEQPRGHEQRRVADAEAAAGAEILARGEPSFTSYLLGERGCRHVLASETRHRRLWSPAMRFRQGSRSGRLSRHGRYVILYLAESHLTPDSLSADPRAHRATRVPSHVIETGTSGDSSCARGEERRQKGTLRLENPGGEMLARKSPRCSVSASVV